MLREFYTKRNREYLENCYKEVEVMMNSLKRIIVTQLPMESCKSKRLIFNIQLQLKEEEKSTLLIELNGKLYVYKPTFWYSECFNVLDIWMQTEEKATILAKCKGGRTYEIQI